MASSFQKSRTKQKPLPQQLGLGSQLLQAGRVRDAAMILEQFVRAHPNHVDGLHLAGLAARASGNVERAYDLIQQAIRKAPGRAVFSFNLALCLADLGRLEDACACLEKVTLSQPTFTDAWYNLGVLSAKQSLFDAATTCYRQLLAIEPNHLAGLNNLAEILGRQGKSPEAISLLRRALKLEPDFADAQYNLGQQILDDSPVEAIALLERVVRSRPKFLDGWRLLAKAIARSGAHERARTLLEEAVANFPDDANLHNDLGLVLLELGHMNLAATQFEAALALSPHHAHALYNFAFMTRGADNTPLLGKIKDAIATQVERSNKDSAMLHFGAGFLLERNRSYDEAFQHFDRGNALIDTDYCPAQTERKFAELMEVFDRRFFERTSSLGVDDTLPLFIVGMPRSGTTLVEQILASHSAGAGAGELLAFNQLANGLQHLLSSSSPYPRCIAELDDTLIRQLANAYLGELRRIGGTRAQRISDKMPGNFLHLGLITLLFPRARIVYCQRDPLDTCISCYTNNFAGDLPFAYRLRHLGHYYHQHAQLMQHWEATLPQGIFTVNYERLVTQPETEIPRLIEFAGLPWDARCLQPHLTKRAISTASNVQVREPIYQRSIGRAECYSQWLNPLKAALQSQQYKHS